MSTSSRSRSFASGDDVEELKTLIADAGSQARVIAKLEDQTGVTHLESIVEAADGLMVARGDLGIEIPYQTLPLVQKKAVATCLEKGKPVIVATQLVESMMESPMPTRAEITDVSNAVCELADAVMLSGETSVGKYPLQSVEVMTTIAETMERSCSFALNESVELHSSKAKLLRAAASVAQDIDAAGIVVFTRSGFMARILSAIRPHGVPIYAFTDNPAIFRSLLLCWGIEPFFMSFSENPEATIRDSFEYLVKRRWCQPRDEIIVVTNVLAGGELVETIQIRNVERRDMHRA